MKRRPDTNTARSLEVTSAYDPRIIQLAVKINL
jgi:hypothetical protein